MLFKRSVHDDIAPLLAAGEIDLEARERDAVSLGRRHSVTTDRELGGPARTPGREGGSAITLAAKQASTNGAPFHSRQAERRCAPSRSSTKSARNSRASGSASRSRRLARLESRDRFRSCIGHAVFCRIGVQRGERASHAVFERRMKDEPLRRALLIAGPKASGKSATALRAGSALVSSTPRNSKPSMPATASSPPAERRGARRAASALLRSRRRSIIGQAAGAARARRARYVLRRTSASREALFPE